MAEIAEIGSTFASVDLRTNRPAFSLPEELWESAMASPCRFEPEIFLDVMINILKNPNITSTYVFRAEILWDSQNSPNVAENPEAELFDHFIKYMKAEYRPIWVSFPGYQWCRTLVVKQVPRNPQLDKALVETCHIFNQIGDDYERNLIVYIPHVSSGSEVPYYHPNVSAFAVQHEWHSKTSSGALSLHFRLFPDMIVDTKLNRVAYNFLKIVHRHGVGRLAGYQKRVHHDIIVQQKKFQDTYTRLKTKYAKQLIESWVEQTDPGKHVFEDLGIAAFLIELWHLMYIFNPDHGLQHDVAGVEGNAEPSNKSAYPGFVDIGCGNGILVYILNSEGYSGWGFDARSRKTWSTFSTSIQQNLKENILVPSVIHDNSLLTTVEDCVFQDGTFPEGTFIISNHADELTAWTPLLAYLNSAPFIAIPCCSHNLAGARCRFHNRPDQPPRSNPLAPIKAEAPHEEHIEDRSSPARITEQEGPGPPTGTLARPKNASKQPSAYASLTAYVSSLAVEVGFEVEKEVLRIPSTRNVAVIGRHCHNKGKSAEERVQIVRDILAREVGSAETVGEEWIERARKMAKSKGSRH